MFDYYLILADWNTEMKAALPIIYLKWKKSKGKKQIKELITEVKKTIRLLWICQAHLNMQLIKRNTDFCLFSCTDNVVKKLNESESEKRKHEKQNRIIKIKRRVRAKRLTESEV